MKTINTYLLALMNVFMLTWTACTDSVDYDPTAVLEGQGAYFAAASASFTIDAASGKTTLQIFRSNKNGNAEIPLTVTYGENVKDFIQVPATASFADGETTAIVNINYNKLVEGQSYKLKVSVADSTPYGNSTISVSLLYSNEPVYTWEKVTDKAIYLDDMFSIIGKGSMKTTDITVEKAKEVNMYRFRSPYDNDYFTATWGGNLFPADFEFNYIVLDGETYKDAKGNPLYYIKKTNLGFKVIVEGTSANVERNTETLMFGSVAVNLSASGEVIPPTSTDYPLGTYDAKKKIFNLGVVYQDIEGVGINIYKAGKFMLYLDANALAPDYDQDYTWISMPGHGGLFTSELADGEWMQSIQQSAENATFYRLPALYSANTALYFYLDQKQGSVSILKGQSSGLIVYNNPIYIEGTPGKSSYDIQTGTLTLGLTLYIADKNGKKAAELIKVVETIKLGTEAESLLRNKSIDDYVGEWKVQVGGAKEGAIPATVTKVDANTLGVSGLSVTGANDMVLLGYDSKSGLLTFEPQEVPSLSPLVDNLPVMIVPLNSALLSLTFKDSFIGGLTADGILRFMNNSANEGVWDAMCFIVLENEQASLLTGLWNYLDWMPLAAVAASTTFKLQPSMGNQVLSREIMPRRIYKTELNIKPTPLQFNNNIKMELIESLNGQKSFLQEVY